MTVGNDLVDLLDPESDPASLHPRYLDRVFIPEEWENLENLHGDVSRLDRVDRVDRVDLWSRWAAKEATYKALAAERPGLVFSPRAFVTSRMEPAADGRRRGWVVHDGHRVPVLLLLLLERSRGGQALHAIAATAGELDPDHAQLLSQVTPISRRQDPSSAVRNAARHGLAKHLGCGEDKLRIRGRRPPSVFVDGQPLALSLSLSHHGAWVAFAAAPDRRRSHLIDCAATQFTECSR